MQRSRHLRISVRVVTVFFVLLAGTASWLTHSQRASAAQTTPPPYSHSWYIKDMSNPAVYPAQPCQILGSNSALYNQGCMDGQWDGTNCTNSLVILDFGQPAFYNGSSYGTNIFDSGNSFEDMGAALVAAEDYARGWYQATPACPRLRLAFGTQNFSECPYLPARGEAHCTLTTWATYWVDMIQLFDTYLTQQSWRWQITPAAADDIEGEWDPPSSTENVVNGFNNGNTSGYIFFDYGDATTGQGWGVSDFAYVAWVASADVPLPEIYHPDSSPNGCQTTGCIGQWITVAQDQAMHFWGPMTECQDGYNFSITESRCTVYPAGQYAPSGSSGAWQDLWNALINHNMGQTDMAYATNINLQGSP